MHGVTYSLLVCGLLVFCGISFHSPPFPSVDDISDDFFEVTVDDLRLMLKDLKNERCDFVC